MAVFGWILYFEFYLKLNTKILLIITSCSSVTYKTLQITEFDIATLPQNYCSAKYLTEDWEHHKPQYPAHPQMVGDRRKIRVPPRFTWHPTVNTSGFPGMFDGSRRARQGSRLSVCFSFHRPLHGFHRHLGCGAVTEKITANVWEILQLSTLTTPQLQIWFWRKMCL